MLDSDWGSIGGEGYTGVEGLGCGERAASEGGVDWAPHQKPSHRGSVLADDLRWGSHLSWEDRFGVGKGGVEVVGERDQVLHKGGGLVGPKTQTELLCLVSVDDKQGGSHLGSGGYLRVGTYSLRGWGFSISCRRGAWVGCTYLFACLFLPFPPLTSPLSTPSTLPSHTIPRFAGTCRTCLCWVVVEQ
jgi:hypothetical protein